MDCIHALGRTVLMGRNGINAADFPSLGVREAEYNPRDHEVGVNSVIPMHTKASHGQSGQTAHIRDRSNLHGTLAGDAERYVKSSTTANAYTTWLCPRNEKIAVVIDLFGNSSFMSSGVMCIGYSAGDVSGVNKGGHQQSGATAHVPKKHILHGTQAGEAERYVDHQSDT